MMQLMFKITAIASIEIERIEKKMNIMKEIYELYKILRKKECKRKYSLRLIISSNTFDFSPLL